MPRRRPIRARVNEVEIGKRLRELRERRDLTQVQLAVKLGIDQTLLSGYERGTIRMHAALVAAIAKTLNASADEILGLKATKTNGIKSRGILKRLPDMDQLPTRELQTLLKTIDTFLKASGPREARA